MPKHLNGIPGSPEKEPIIRQLVEPRGSTVGIIIYMWLENRNLMGFHNLCWSPFGGSIGPPNGFSCCLGFVKACAFFPKAFYFPPPPPPPTGSGHADSCVRTHPSRWMGLYEGKIGGQESVYSGLKVDPTPLPQ